MSTFVNETTKETLPANIRLLLDGILEEIPLHKRFIRGAIANIKPDELSQLDGYLGYCLQRGLDLEYLTRSYLTIVEDTINEQLYFIENREYRNKSFVEVADNVYFNDEYMHRYMYGLALTSFLWPNHLALARFFHETLPRSKEGHYLEVGPGHGYYLVTSMRESAFGKFLGIDISEASIEQTQGVVEYFCPQTSSNFELRLADFLDVEKLEEGDFDAIVMGEVLEHVEQPEAFLKRIAQLAKRDAYIFITTCINAPAIDHIYLWRNTDVLEEMIRDTGLRIKHSLYLPYEGKTLEQCVANDLAINVAYVLEAV